MSFYPHMPRNTVKISSWETDFWSILDPRTLKLKANDDFSSLTFSRGCCSRKHLLGVIGAATEGGLVIGCRVWFCGSSLASLEAHRVWHLEAEQSVTPPHCPPPHVLSSLYLAQVATGSLASSQWLYNH